MVTLQGPQGLGRARVGAVYCCPDCKRAWTRRRSAEVMAETNRRTASARMKANNPMSRPEARKRLSNTLRKMKWRPRVRGGNGHGPTPPQQRLADLLELETEVVVRTKMPRGSGYPTCYKLDLGDHELRLGIEVDGHSHSALGRREQDAKKDAFLASLGWTVLRFTNAAAMASGSCAQMVVSTIWRSRATTTTSRMGS